MDNNNNEKRNKWIESLETKTNLELLEMLNRTQGAEFGSNGQECFKYASKELEKRFTENN